MQQAIFKKIPNAWNKSKIVISVYMTSPQMNQILNLNEMSMSSSVVLSVVALSGKSVFTKHSVSSGWMNENTAKRVTRTMLIGVLQMRYPTADPMWNLFNLNTFLLGKTMNYLLLISLHVNDCSLAMCLAVIWIHTCSLHVSQTIHKKLNLFRVYERALCRNE